MTVLEQRATRSRSHLLALPLASGLAGAAALTALHLRDPHQSGSWGFCPFLLITGQPCPGCGGLRAMNDLSNGDIAGALGSNAAAVALLVAGVAVWGVWIARRAAGQDVPALRIGLRGGMIVLVAFVLFGAFRWTPWGAALAP